MKNKNVRRIKHINSYIFIIFNNIIKSKNIQYYTRFENIDEAITMIQFVKSWNIFQCFLIHIHYLCLYNKSLRWKSKRLKINYIPNYKGW